MSVQTATRRIAHAFERGKTFVAYITGGDPAPEMTVPLVHALERGGAGLIELGVPFSDPIADGPVIQRASERALRGGVTLRRLLEDVRTIRLTSEIPIILFSYLNPLMRYGFERLAKEASEAGVDGVLLTDLSVEEAEQPVKQLRRFGLDTVFLAAPTSRQRRLELVAEHSSGFIYLVSRTGVTGEQEKVSESVRPLIERLRPITKLPLAVGFGISTPGQVKEVASLADGVVVGSALVKCVERHAHAADLPVKLEQFVRSLTEPLRSR